MKSPLPFEEPRVVERRVTGRRTILLCEDQEEDAEIFQRALKVTRIPTQVTHLPDGERALEYLQGAIAGDPAAEIPSLVFLDLKMPFVSGFEVLAWMREHREFDHTCVVVVSSSAEPRDVSDAYARGANGYFAKPPRAADLLATVNLVAHNSAPWLGSRLQEFGVGH
jgi:CheY-like chemotaxis protein